MDVEPTEKLEAVDDGIAKLLQTVIEAKVLISEDQKPTDIDNSSSSSSELDSSSSSSSDEDEDSDIDMRNNAADAESDIDSDDSSGPHNQRHRTRNEEAEAPVLEASIKELPEGSTLTSLGAIRSVVDGSVVIQAHISGERHVLDIGSVLAFDDRRVLGVVHDVFGPVSRPMYTVRFHAEQAEHFKGAIMGRQVFFSATWAKMLPTDGLRVRGTDASNEHDEEVGPDGMEFSDDEAERIHRKQIKQSRQQSRRQQQDAAANANPTPAAAPVAAPAAPQHARKLQSYQDLYDADLGF
ncbi:hypothetical protein GGI04_001148 [Coemansia thaxteri]|uniref:H/ACA ribonucleoprotein complex subunit n=1 Tax=Coemansia thaxteri TaxID=2663907 RepID=A0A9W8EEC7_9FUNG|nr:hypothetical protein H4R26_004086 [Coemansia thaxteri]KAJ2008398.1 hypothetical protein GGI04_001148 [Coemansia thaxteri]KAJ2471802.1 hypothetical protein GGI02_002026 [Coemansia sp. RSA 2322]KAJ2481881.1 hypothetical protein EV174_003355 [Coemansia sp. RSA 2320]